jgi:hypothetical protein
MNNIYLECMKSICDAVHSWLNEQPDRWYFLSPEQEAWCYLFDLVYGA